MQPCVDGSAVQIRATQFRASAAESLCTGHIRPSAVQNFSSPLPNMWIFYNTVRPNLTIYKLQSKVEYVSYIYFFI